MKLFSIPYNGSNPDKYLDGISKYSNNIDSIFFGDPYTSNSHVNPNLLNQSYEKNLENLEKNTKIFLKLSDGKYKRLMTLNSGFYDLSCYDLDKFLSIKLFPFFERYNIDGCICTDFNMAIKIHKAYPGMEMHTSCNCFQWLTRQMEIWHNEAGIEVFNPPREILRTPEKLKEFHDSGFKIKAIINESCLYGCPQTINHCMALAAMKKIECQCNRLDLSNAFKGNYILPRWLKYFDKYVDIYKISGRMSTTNYILNCLDAYINERDDINLEDIVIGGNIKAIKELGLSIPTKIIPDKLLTCECKNCNKTCFVCSDLMEGINPKHIGL